MADFLMTRARRLFQYVTLHGTNLPPDESSNINDESHLSTRLPSVRATNNNSGSHLVGEHVHNNLNGTSLNYSTSSQNGSISNMSKLIRQQKQKRCILMGTIICGLAALIVIALVWKQDAGNKKRAAILEKYAIDPQTASFSSATSLGAASVASHKRPVGLYDFIWSRLVPAQFNGTWVSDSDIMYKDEDGGITVLNLESNKAYQLMSSNMTTTLHIRGLKMSSNKKYLLIKRTHHSVFRRSSFGIYSILQIGANGRHLKKSFELKPRNYVPPNGEENHGFQIRYVSWAPTGSGLVYVDYENNIYYRKSAYERDIQLTTSGKPGVVYNGIPDWVFEEEVFEDNYALWWSPNSSNLVFGSFDDTMVNTYVLPEYGYWQNPVAAYPSYTDLRFPKVNTTNPKIDLWLVDLASLNSSNNVIMEEHIKIHPPVSLTSNGEETHFSGVTWADDSHFAVTWMNRVQNKTVVSLCGVDPAGISIENPTSCSQKRNEIFSQSSSDGWIEYKYRIVFNPNPPNPKNKDFVVISAAPFLKHHYRQLLYVSGNDKSRTFLTKMDGVEVVEILAWTKENYIYFISNLPQQPGSRHIFRIRSPTAPRLADRANNGLPECLTCSSASEYYTTPNGGLDNMDYLHRNPCNYYSAEFSLSKGYYTMTCEGPGIPWTCIHKTVAPTKSQRHDKFVMVYEDNLDLEARASRYNLPDTKTISVPVSNSDQEANVKLYFPPDFDPNQKYPLVVYVYGGPGYQVVDDKWNQYEYQTYLAGQGFIYALIDPKGSGFQGDDWRFSIYRKFGTAEVESTLEVTEYLQNNFTYVDRDRSAIWGWSYGGFLSLSVLVSDTRSIFKCGASVAPVTDWRLYDTYYTERYMGLLSSNKAGYDNARVFERLDNLKRYNKRYFVAHGTHDDNVHFQQSMLLSAALEEKDILFQQHAYPDQDHSIAAYHKHLYHTLTDFFQNECFRDSARTG